MRRLIFVSLSLIVSLISVAQKETNNWLFATNTGLNFNTNPPTVINNAPISFSFGSSCYSDEDGVLVLATDGNNVWNGSGGVLTNGLNIGGDAGCSQSSLVVPDPSRPNSFYLFAVDKLSVVPGQESRCFTYSRADMNGDQGNGVISEKGTLLIEETPEYVTGVKHANGTDYWVIAHGLGDNRFYVYRITKEDGLLSGSPHINEVGAVHNGVINTQGVLKVSPDGQYLASTQIDGVVEIFSFDRETGDMQLIDSENVEDAYGAEFDADSRFLYVSTSPGFGSGNQKSRILQYDLSLSLPLSTPPYVVHEMVKDTVFASLQLALDRKIYCANFVNLLDRGQFISVIQNPSRRGASCNYNYRNDSYDPWINLGGKKMIAGLPNFVTSFLDIPFFTYDSICFGNDVTFDVVNKTNIDSYAWNFGDPNSGNNVATGANPVHRFSESGTYDVSVTVTFNGTPFTYTEKVVVNPLPIIDFPPGDLYLYPGSVSLLEVDDIYAFYLWQDGATSHEYLVTQPGTYTVRVTDSLGCWDHKSIDVLLADIYFPNAFTPNGDGINDEFGPKGASSGLFNLRMYIYNRMGQRMYKSPVLPTLGSSNNGSFAWDGTVGGKEQPAGTYVWTILFDIERERGVMETQKYTGSVTLLR
ncbi:MAG: hypothetical protein CSA95_05135 [Bacteroidetes bacterium]|nr:MAG: hypothetical protein CSA95_05135 [Bacteroidota bacterium]